MFLWRRGAAFRSRPSSGRTQTEEIGAAHAIAALGSAPDQGEVERLPKSPSIRLGVATSCVSMISEFGRNPESKGRFCRFALHVSQCPPHAASGAIARYFEISGNVLTVSTACAAGMDAIGLAARDIVSGVADYVDRRRS